ALIGSKSRRVAPASFQLAPGGMPEFELTFPRKASDGEPLIEAGEKTLGVELVHPSDAVPDQSGGGGAANAGRGGRGGGRRASADGGNVDNGQGTIKVYVPFKVNEMKLNGETVF